MPYRIDRQLVAPWEVPPLEVFLETWEHVLSSALFFSVRAGRRSFKQTKAAYKQGSAQFKRLGSEPYTFEKVTEIVADWLGYRQGENREQLLLAWAADLQTEGVVAAHAFAMSYRESVNNRPQMALPI